MNNQEAELHAAANRGDLYAIAELLGVQIERPWASYRPHTAAELEDIQQCNPQVADENGMTALMWAAMEGSARCVELLIPKSNVNARSKTGLTALSIAVRGLRTDCIAALIPNISESDVMELISDTLLEELIADRRDDATEDRRSATQRQLGAERARREKAALWSAVAAQPQFAEPRRARRAGL